MKSAVRTPEEALAYITDCTLATVSGMAGRKNRPSGEYRRQLSIAQTAIDWMREMKVDMSGTRAADVEAAGGQVHEWAKKYEVPRL